MNRLANFYLDREHYILGGGFIVLLILAWESVPHVITLPRGLSLFFTTPSKVSEAFYDLIIVGGGLLLFAVSMGWIGRWSREE